jgi:hypothetical protein
MPEPRLESNADFSLESSSESGSEQSGWYIRQQPEGHCTIESAPDSSVKQWGPYDSQGAAIARRVGLIRAGHCKPV